MDNQHWKNTWKKIRDYNSNDRTQEIQVSIIVSEFNFNTFIDCGPGTVGDEIS